MENGCGRRQLRIVLTGVVFISLAGFPVLFAICSADFLALFPVEGRERQVVCGNILFATGLAAMAGCDLILADGVIGASL
ncbi:MAG: hypothetical protein IPM55_07160 [Acidobacteria bacterium]|nr:hypothetical protein [Acidobacteriota bacterium]